MLGDSWPEGFEWPVKNLSDFTSLFYVILRRKFSEWLESSSGESELDMRFAIWSLDLAIRDLLSSNTVSSVWTGHEKEYLTYFRESGKRNCFIRDPWFFCSWTVPETPLATLYDPLEKRTAHRRENPANPK